ncbi:unnamed protein product, partial [Pleuronectes platessa]
IAAPDTKHQINGTTAEAVSSLSYLTDADCEDHLSQSWVILGFRCGHGHSVSS